MQEGTGHQGETVVRTGRGRDASICQRMRTNPRTAH